MALDDLARTVAEQGERIADLEAVVADLMPMYPPRARAIQARRSGHSAGADGDNMTRGDTVALREPGSGSDTPSGSADDVSDAVDLSDDVHALAARFGGTGTDEDPYPSDKRLASKAIACLLGRGWRPPALVSAPADGDE